MIEKLVYFGLCAAAVMLAAHFPLEQRRSAVRVAFLIPINWLICEWTYTAYGPQYGLWAIGLPVWPTDIWAFCDASVGIAALWRGHRYFWAWWVWAISVIQCSFHWVYEQSLVTDSLYSSWLDKLLLAMIAVFILGGSRGVGNRVSAIFARRGGIVRLRTLDARQARKRR